MLLTIWNFTREPIPGYVNPQSILNKFNIQSLKKQKLSALQSPAFTLEPHVDFSTTLPKGCFKMITLLLRVGFGDIPADNEVPSVEPEEQTKFTDAQAQGLHVPISIGCTRSWKLIPLPNDSPWKLFLVRITRKHRKLMIFQNRDMASFLSQLPDRLPLSSLLLPGTHETVAFYGWPISQCQTSALSTQFQDGIRVIDIRLAVIPPPIRGAAPPGIIQNLIAYHGKYPEKTPFRSILNDIYQFLSSPVGQNETIVVSIKQEDFSVTPPPIFSQLVREAMINGPGGWDEAAASGSGVNRGMWFLENRIPTLGDVRGKAILFSRFGGDGAGWPQGLEGLGIHPTTWPDNRREPFEWELKGTHIRTCDWYGIPSTRAIPEKVQVATTNLIPPTNLQPVLPISFFSGSKFPAPLPPTVAKGVAGVEGVNSLLGKWLLSQIGSMVPSNVTEATETQPVVEEHAVQNPSPAEEITGMASTSAIQPQVDDGQRVGREPRIRGWPMLDFYSEPSGIQVVPLLVECNFLGRRPGEEGW